jgi:hypothetical protein
MIRMFYESACKTETFKSKLFHVSICLSNPFTEDVSKFHYFDP